MLDFQGLERALKAQKCSLFFSESPTNPYLRCVDVPTIAQLCHEAGCLVCIDSTFATPINQRAISLGADLVIHSATKYLAGHNDVMAGAPPSEALFGPTAVHWRRHYSMSVAGNGVYIQPFESFPPTSSGWHQAIRCCQGVFCSPCPRNLARFRARLSSGWRRASTDWVGSKQACFLILVWQ